VFDHFFVTLQAVVDGFGIGVGPLPVLQTDVAGGVSSLRSRRSLSRGPAILLWFPSTPARHRS
jgi:hypothetical protein